MDNPNGRVIADELKASPLPEETCIQINIDDTANTFVFPWSLLYDGDFPHTSNEVDPKRFWGVRHEIEQVRTRPERRTSRRRTKPRLAVFLDSSIAHAKEQMAAIKALTDGDTSRLALAHPFVENRALLEAKLASGGDALLYFFCHGATALPASELGDDLRRRAAALAEEAKPAWLDRLFGATEVATQIMLTRATVALEDMWRIGRPREPEGPIVILNMCESAQLMPEVGSSFVRFFLDGRASAVLGTECPVPPDFASDFGIKLLKRLAEGQPIGAALRQLRTEYLVSHSNPLALAYTLWGQTSSRVEFQDGEQQHA
jgi:hypothetical protein